MSSFPLQNRNALYCPIFRDFQPENQCINLSCPDICVCDSDILTVYQPTYCIFNTNTPQVPHLPTDSLLIWTNVYWSPDGGCWLLVLVNRDDKACSCRLHDHVVMIAVADNINLTLPKIIQHIYILKWHKHVLIIIIHLKDENIKRNIFVLFNWKNARWLNNFDLIWNKMLFTDFGSPFHDTCMCIYAHVFSKGFCICSKLFPNINFWIFEKLYYCYFRAEIMKQMKNPRKWMRKMSFQVNSERVCTHVNFIIIRRNEQAHVQSLLFLQHQRFLFVSYTEVCGFISLDMFIHGRLKCV